jgi:glucosamine 6-phosphate synthetase-like amidotransferase/phosphosugar isomerase protein
VQNPLKTSHLCLFRLQTLKIPVNARLRLDKPRNLAKSVTVE